jgi:hypothetical protein
MKVSNYHRWYNKGLTNEVYCRKVNFGTAGIHLDTDHTYVLDSISIILSFIQFLNNEIFEKFHLDKDGFR